MNININESPFKRHELQKLPYAFHELSAVKKKKTLEPFCLQGGCRDVIRVRGCFER